MRRIELLTQTGRLRSLARGMILAAAMGRFAQSGFEELPIVDPEDPATVIGMLRRQDIIAAYSTRLMAMRS